MIHPFGIPFSTGTRYLVFHELQVSKEENKILPIFKSLLDQKLLPLKGKGDIGSFLKMDSSITLFDKMFNTLHDDLITKRAVNLDKLCTFIENPDVPFGANKKDLKFEILTKYGIPFVETPPSQSSEETGDEQTVKKEVEADHMNSEARSSFIDSILTSRNRP